MINVTRTYLPPFEEFCEEIRSLWDSRIVTNMGPKHEEFREALERMLDAHVSLFANGHLALEGVLRAMELPQGGEVVTTPLSFASTVNAIIRCGLKPVFADVLESDGTLDPALAERAITPRTVAILPVHVYGNVCDAEAFADIASRHGLPLIYDAAHAFGVRYKGRSALTLGDASIVSFHATKVFSTIEGGAVVFADGEQNFFIRRSRTKLFDGISQPRKVLVRGGKKVLSSGDMQSFLESLDDEKNFGIRDYELCVSAGGNAKMNELQAAMGLCNLRHFDEVLAARKAVYELYRSLLPGSVRVLEPRGGIDPNYSYLPVLLENRDRAYALLLDNGIRARKYFYPLLSDLPFCEPYRVDTPVARNICDHVLCLPLYPGLEPADVERICTIL